MSLKKMATSAELQPSPTVTDPELRPLVRARISGSRSHDSRSIAVVVVVDHFALRSGLEQLLRSHGHQVVGATESPERALELIAEHRPDVALIDVDLGCLGGIELARRLLSERPALAILLYSGREEPATLAGALACGARGFAFKSAPPEEFLDAITTVARGESWLDPRLPRLLGRSAHQELIQPLSARESEVLDLLADGMTGQAIAQQLFLSPETVRTHVRNAMRKLGARTRSQAIAMIVRGHNRPLPSSPRRSPGAG